MSHKIRPFEIHDGHASFIGTIRRDGFHVLALGHEVRLKTVLVGSDGSGAFALVHEGVFALPRGVKLELEAEAEDPPAPGGLSLRVYREGRISAVFYFDAEGTLHSHDREGP